MLQTLTNIPYYLQNPETREPTLGDLKIEFMEGARTRFGIIVDASAAEQFLLDNHRDVENALEAYNAHLVEFQRATNTTELPNGRTAHDGRSDVTEIPKELEAGNSKAKSSILAVKQSNSFAPLAEMVDKAAAESSASVTYKCDKTHCTGEHFVGANAKREYAKHIQEKHRGLLTESESNRGLLQCKTCGKVTYTGENAAKRHQDACAVNTGGASQASQRNREVTHGWRCSCKHKTQMAATPEQERVHAEGSRPDRHHD